MDFESQNWKLTYSGGVLLCILGRSLAGALSHVNDNSTFFESHFIQQSPAL
jgi:hypothetical protein